jgi:hypothetical protein
MRLPMQSKDTASWTYYLYDTTGAVKNHPFHLDKKSYLFYTMQVLATLAQLVEHLIRNERVVCSNQISGSSKIKASEKSGAYFFSNIWGTLHKF